jgi:predicted enzyme related to lactoylglutathione lyase
MPEVTTITANAPTWVDLSSPDIEASKQFYSQVFGWEPLQIGGPEMGNYTFFNKGGKNVGGAASTNSPDQHPAWTPYFAAPNADETAEKIRTAGGEIVMEPDDVPGGAGRMCVFKDSTGAYAGLWQAGMHRGFGIWQEVGSVSWVEMQSRDIAKAKQFYKQVFGWNEETMSMGPGGPEYTMWKLDGASFAGGMDMQPMVPANVPPHWLVYFQVENVDPSAEQIKALGGQVLVGPMPIPGGRFVVATDPQGATFGITDSNQ